MAISAKTTKVMNEAGEPREVTVDLTIPEDIKEMVEDFGQDAVASAAHQHFRIQAQAAIRRLIENGESDDAINTKMADWKPGMKIAAAPADPKAAFKAAWARMSEEEREAMLAELG